MLKVVENFSTDIKTRKVEKKFLDEEEERCGSRENSAHWKILLDLANDQIVSHEFRRGQRGVRHTTCLVLIC